MRCRLACRVVTVAPLWPGRATTVAVLPVEGAALAGAGATLLRCAARVAIVLKV